MLLERVLTVEVVPDDAWDATLNQFDDANYRQLSVYSAAAAARVGARSENVAIRLGGDLLGICNVRTRKIPLLPIGIAYINGAPVIQRSRTSVDYGEALSACLRALHKEFVCRRGYVLRIVGIVCADFPHDIADRIFREAEFNPCDAKGRYRTILTDINRDLADIRKGFDQKWRNVLNKAERQELTVIRGTGPELFLAFQQLYRGLVERKKLSVDLGPDFFQGLQESLTQSDQFVVHLAMQSGEPVAGHIGAYHGDTAIYLLGAANDVGLKCNASYLLQWHVIQYAKERACRWYDLGGIDPEGNPDVYRFKARIGGIDVCAPGPYESGPPLRRALLQKLESLYRMIRK